MESEHVFGSLIEENLGWKGTKQRWEEVRGWKTGMKRQISYDKSLWGFKPSFLQSRWIKNLLIST